MKLKLGIDTGGSYTDAVLVDCDTGEVVSKAKARTTKENLTIGIEEAIDKLGINNTAGIVLVCLSTTLATNAIVEGKGAKVGLITIDEPKEYNYPVSCKSNIKGKIDVKGCEVFPLNVSEAAAALETMKDEIDTLVISGYASVRNPAYELKTKELSNGILGVPVICAHELTNVLGYYERTITAVLNAKLIPVIKELILATKEVLSVKGIKATLVIIKGDGNCMAGSFAEERPIETVLSGPAASALGGILLSGKQDLIVADMGGTTLDIVPIRNGNIPLDECGATVGGWRTRVKAMHTRSFGLGGDSYMRMNNLGAIDFGPQRVVPLCAAAEKYKNLIWEIESLHLPEDYHIIGRQEADCVALFKRHNIDRKVLTAEENQIIELLTDGAHSMLYLAGQLSKDVDGIDIARLLQMEIIYLISATPTDLLHATGEYVQYDRKISQLAMERLAARKKMAVDEFEAYAENAFTDRICVSLIESLLIEKGITEEKLSEELIRTVFSDDDERCRLIDFDCRFHAPIVGIGAPAKTWLTKAGRKLKCEVIVPQNSEVANAIGTVSGNIRETLEALIRFDCHTKKYIAHLPNRRVTFDSLDEAIGFVERELILYGKAFADKMGVKKYSSDLSKEQIVSEGYCNSESNFVELRLKMAISANAKYICH
ncbi:hydantoinase/oxoprolinase family protein [Anaerovorax odorimutans]|uniref:Hydantoinase/oxoprolinase family protein n=1 Tax=Anaerovorax odorimutans TaxID=109327 RepID=A0ABT1RRP0_9FIRM|nr:hydantoinase/oxoprolinase family protein [Anaerovorax odorimutans]MCQ4637859.1 hydantoinase/oxoprolinase family protein [Anaerovorax odorimutans]